MTKLVTVLYPIQTGWERADFDDDQYPSDKELIDTTFDNMQDMLHDWVSDGGPLEDDFISFVSGWEVHMEDHPTDLIWKIVAELGKKLDTLVDQDDANKLRHQIILEMIAQIKDSTGFEYHLV
jgi:hypothetical protein